MADKMREKKVIILCGIICTTLIICGILFWPTLYRYDKMATKPVRINRFTGYTEILYPDGWKATKTEKAVSLITDIEKDKIKLNGMVDGSYYKADIYNGSSYTIKRITVYIGVSGGYEQEKIKFERIYSTSVSISPLSTNSFSIKLRDPELGWKGSKGEHLSVEELAKIAGYHFDVKIKEAFGYIGE